MNLSTLGARLRHARSQTGMTLREVATQIGGVSNPFISQLETGKVDDCSARTLAALADAYGVSIDWLLGREPDHSAPLSALRSRATAHPPAACNHGE